MRVWVATFHGAPWHIWLSQIANMACSDKHKNNKSIRSLTSWLHPTKTCALFQSNKKCRAVLLISKYITGLEKKIISFFHQENQKYLLREDSLQLASSSCWTLSWFVLGTGDRIPPNSDSVQLVERCTSWHCLGRNYLKFFPLPLQLLVASIFSPNCFSFVLPEKSRLFFHD